MSEISSETSIAYIGPTGAGFGFQLSGITVFELNSSQEVVSTLKNIKKEGQHGIVFVDELLAEEHSEAIEKINKDPLPAIILLPNPSQPKNVAAAQLQQLMVRAIGSDIFSTK